MAPSEQAEANRCVRVQDSADQAVNGTLLRLSVGMLRRLRPMRIIDELFMN